MTNPSTVKDALESLVTDEPRVTSTRRRAAYRRTIEEARAATGDVTTMATFADAEGVVRLRRAVRTAARRGDDGAANAGRDALNRIEEFRRAANHFHSARGIVLGGDGQRRDE